jgi:hypothetical protein
VGKGLNVEPSAVQCVGRSTWQLLALSDEALEQADIVEINLAVAREIPRLAKLDVDRYCRIVNDWTERFASQLPEMERGFAKTPWKWKNDIHFFRVGMLAGFIGQELGIDYIEDQKHVTAIAYTNPSDLFLNGLIDTKRGTCGSMPTLHVAIARRLGWPVGLAAVKSHHVSRFDDGAVTYNFEASVAHPGAFSSDTDEAYLKRFDLPRKAIACGSDLRKLTAREMMAIFISLRARHFSDIDDLDQADRDYCLARALFPRHRCSFRGAIIPMVRRGEAIYDPNEVGHPSWFADAIREYYGGRAPGPADRELPRAMYSISLAPAQDTDPLVTARRSDQPLFATAKISGDQTPFA